MVVAGWLGTRPQSIGPELNTTRAPDLRAPEARHKNKLCQVIHLNMSYGDTSCITAMAKGHTGKYDAKPLQGGWYSAIQRRGILDHVKWKRTIPTPNALDLTTGATRLQPRMLTMV